MFRHVNRQSNNDGDPEILNEEPSFAPSSSTNRRIPCSVPVRKHVKTLLGVWSKRPVLTAGLLAVLIIASLVVVFFSVSPPIVVWEAVDPRTTEFGDASAVNLSRLQVVLFVPTKQGITVDRTKALLLSLRNATYPHNESVCLHIHLYPGTRSVHGSTYDLLPASMRSSIKATSIKDLDNVLSQFEWPYGAKTLFTHASEFNLSRVSSKLSEVSVFVFADTASLLSPDYFLFAVQAESLSRGTAQNSITVGPPILAASLDSIVATALPNSRRRGSNNRLSRSSVFFPATSGFLVTRESWSLFLAWLKVQQAVGNNNPGVSSFIVGAADFSKSRDLRAFFSHFVASYGGHVVYASGTHEEMIIVRDPAQVTDASESGNILRSAQGSSVVRATNMLQAMHLLSKRDVGDCCVLSQRGSFTDLHLPSPIETLHADGHFSEKHTVPLSSHDVSLGSKPLQNLGMTQLSEGAKLLSAFAHEDSVRNVARFGRSRGSGSIAFTIVTSAFLETTYSWICNALAVNALPRALVFGASGSDVAQSLNSFVRNEPRISSEDILVIDLGGDINALQRAKSRDAALDFGQSEYWMLMMERTAFLGDVLDAGVGVLHFETDQIWFQDPMPWIFKSFSGPDQFGGRGEGYPLVDMVLTINTRKEASGNFFYLRPTLATRHLWAIVSTAFQRSYEESLRSYAARKGKFHYIDNDQSLLTQYGLGRNNWYNRNFPVARYAVLDRQRFVDGTWYLDFEDEHQRPVGRRWYYTSEESLHPIILNNNFMIGVEGKKKRAQRFGHWFLSSEGRKCNSSVTPG